MTCSGEDRAYDDDTDHADEHHTDVGCQGQTECVGQSESLEGMATEKALPEFADAAHQADVKTFGGNAQAGPDRRQRRTEANANATAQPRREENVSPSLPVPGTY